MSRLADLELRLLCRRIVCVASWFDDDATVPWDYVERSGDGRFEAFTTQIKTHEDHEEGVPVSLGVYGDVKAAVRAILEYDKHVDALMQLRRFNGPR